MFSLLQLFWGTLPYFQHSRAINEEYARRQGYQYHAIEVAEDEPDEPLKRLYNRAPEAFDLLRADSPVLYLDADAYVVNLDRPLDEIMDLYFQDPKTVMLFSENGFDASRRWSHNEVNTGVFLLRNHEQSRAIIKDWWDAYEPALAAVPANASDVQRYQLLNDQEVFNRRVLPKYRENINIARNPEFGGVDGEFIRHQLLIPNQDREARIAKDRQRLGL